MKANIKKVNYDEAVLISKWTYEEPYSNYTMDDSCIDEFLSCPYFSVTDKDNSLLGYYCFGEPSQVPAGKQYGVYDNRGFTDIGLGMKPDLCGLGLGFDFLKNGMEYARNQLSAERFRLTVAAFNKRAIKVYERVGFKKVDSFKRVTETGEIEFWVMILD